MSERRRMLLIFGVVGGLLGAPAVYFFGVHRPGKARAAAQSEIAGWEARWQQARECLVGSSRASSSVAELLAIRELGVDLANRGGCTKLIGNLTRGAGDATDVDDVEVAWPAIDIAAGKVARSYVTHIAPTKQSPEAAADALAAALAEMDDAQAKLRAAAGMPALPARATAALPRATLLALTLGGEPLAILSRAAISNGGILARGATATRSGLIVHGAGKAPIVMQLGAAQRSVPDLGWGAVGTDERLDSGALDAAGQLTGPPSTLALSAHPNVVFALGNAANGVVVYTIAILGTKATTANSNVARVFVARSANGKLSTDGGQAFAQVRYDVDPAGRALIAWVDETGKRAGMLLQSAIAAPAVVELGSGRLEETDRVCLTGQRGWIVTRDQVVSFGDAAVAQRPLADHGLVGCAADAALLHEHGTMRFVICPDAATDCRRVELATAHPTAVPVVVGDRLFAIASQRRVLGVWRERGEPVYFATEQPFTPLYAISAGNAIDVLGRTERGLAIARLPAS